jgi:hypothetical protein
MIFLLHEFDLGLALGLWGSGVKKDGPTGKPPTEGEPDQDQDEDEISGDQDA